MWGNFADKVNTQDWSGTLQKLGNAVAPPPDDDDDYEYYDEDDEEGSEEYSDDDEDNDANAAPSFGFVGMLARALDAKQESGDFEDEPSEKDDRTDYSIFESPRSTRPQTQTDPHPHPQNSVTDANEVAKSLIREQSNVSNNSIESPPSPTPASIISVPSMPPEPTPVNTQTEERGLTGKTETESTTAISETSTKRYTSLPQEEKDQVVPRERTQRKTQTFARPPPQAHLSLPERTNTKKNIEKQAESLDSSKLSEQSASSSHKEQRQQKKFDNDISKEQVSSNQLTRAAKSSKSLSSSETSKSSIPTVPEKLEPTKPSTLTESSTKFEQLIDTTPTIESSKEPSRPFPIQNREEDASTGTTELTERNSTENIQSKSLEEKSSVRKNSFERSSSVQPGKDTTSSTTEKESSKGTKIIAAGEESRPHPKLGSYNDETHNAVVEETNSQIAYLKEQLTAEKKKSDELREAMMIQFQQKEKRLMEASAEEYQHELTQLNNRHQAALHALEMRMANEKKEFMESQQEAHRLIEQSTERAEQAEAEMSGLAKQHEAELHQATQQGARSLRAAEEKIVQTMALLDEREEEVTKLKQSVKKLESSMDEHEEGVEEAEQEVEELQIENDELQEKLHQLEEKCANLIAQVSTLEDDATKLGPLQMELTMLREERDRERAKSLSMVENTKNSHSQVESERDEAVAEVHDLKQQLVAAHADLSVAKSDHERILMANSNLQAALEAFQDERQAEFNMLEQQRAESEKAIQSTHEAEMEVIGQTHADHVRQVQSLADEKLRQAADEASDLKIEINKLKTENLQNRRSLDEAIHRLQTTQEDVIDRVLMKNILLDWCTMKDKEKRQQVLELMANVLHFTDKERESIHLTHLDIDSVRSKVVGAIAAPLPASKASLEKLQGDNVSEKWINFLMAETDDDI